jgi:polysaccharide biosynthesis transport protein
MVGDDQRDAGKPAGAYVEALKRGWLIVLAAALLVPAAAYEISARQGPLFQATSEDVIGTQSSLSASTQGPNSHDAQYYVATQAAIASSQTVASLALKIAKVPGMTPEDLLKQSSVSADPTSSIVVFTVSNRTHASAIKLANAYAQAFADYSRTRATSALDTLIAANKRQINAISTKITGIGATINRERRAGRSTAVQQAQLGLERTQLAVLAGQAADLQQQKSGVAGTITVSSPATTATQTQPRTTRNTAVAVVLGIVLGLGAALLRDALDTRVRSAEEVGEILGLPLLGRLPAPPRRLRKRRGLVLMSGDEVEHGEAYHKLRVSFDFANLEPRAGVVMVTSAVSEEGKSTTAANLAVALASIGRRVILVDLDLRQPTLHKFFGLEDRPSVSDVILGTASIADSLARVGVPDKTGVAPANAHGNGYRPHGSGGVLYVLPGGAAPTDPTPLLASRALADLLQELRLRADLVLVDTPPVLPLSDAMTISAATDGYVIVSRVDLVRRRTLWELRRELGASNATGLGFVITDADIEPSPYRNGTSRSPDRPIGEPGSLATPREFSEVQSPFSLPPSGQSSSP